MTVDRRSVLAGLALLGAGPATAATITDAAGRTVPIPARVSRVFPAGPPAAIQLYTLAPDLLIGWPRANRADEQAFLLPEVGARREVGRITGRGNTANFEDVLATRPDLILDIGSVAPTFIELATRVQAQLNIPYALLDGRFEATAQTYRTLGRLLGREERAEELAAWTETTLRTLTERIERVPAATRPRTYYARGPQGLETGLGGSINVETIEFLGAINVAAGTPGRGLATVSIEQVLAWNPAVIITIDQTFAATVYGNRLWASVRAVRDRRVHLSPKLPFGWVDFPPSVNRLIGLWWLAKILYPAEFPEDIRALTRDFYQRFYHVSVSDADLERVLAGRD